MSGFDVINVRKEIGCSNANCFVKKVEVASGMTQNSRPCMCSKSCTPMFETTGMVEESVIAPCLAFFPAVLERPREAPTYVYPAKILFRALKSAIILAWKVLSIIRLVTWSQNVMFRYIIWKKFPPARGTWYSAADTISWAAYHLYLISSLFCGFLVRYFHGFEMWAGSMRPIRAKENICEVREKTSLKLPICNDFWSTPT